MLADTHGDGRRESEGGATLPPQPELTIAGGSSSPRSFGDVNSAAFAVVTAGAMQAWNLAKLQKFSGEKVNDDDGLRQFVLEFERHAQLAGWTGATKQLQFEVHLSGRALRMYESL